MIVWVNIGQRGARNNENEQLNGMTTSDSVVKTSDCVSQLGTS